MRQRYSGERKPGQEARSILISRGQLIAKAANLSSQIKVNRLVVLNQFNTPDCEKLAGLLIAVAHCAQQEFGSGCADCLVEKANLIR